MEVNNFKLMVNQVVIYIDMYILLPFSKKVIYRLPRKKNPDLYLISVQLFMPIKTITFFLDLYEDVGYLLTRNILPGKV